MSKSLDQVTRELERTAARLPETQRLAIDLDMNSNGGRMIFRALCVAETTNDKHAARAITDLARILMERES